MYSKIFICRNPHTIMVRLIQNISWKDWIFKFCTLLHSFQKVEDKTLKPIICDFGVSKLKDGTMVTNDGGSDAGTLAYQHKEQLQGEKPTMAVDV